MCCSPARSTASFPNDQTQRQRPRGRSDMGVDPFHCGLDDAGGRGAPSSGRGPRDLPRPDLAGHPLPCPHPGLPQGVERHGHCRSGRNGCSSLHPGPLHSCWRRRPRFSGRDRRRPPRTIPGHRLDGRTASSRPCRSGGARADGSPHSPAQSAPRSSLPRQ